MDKTAIEELFAPVGRVTLRRMFGGAGIYRGEFCVALLYDGIVWLKTDDATRPAFEQAGSSAFTYNKKSGEVSVMSFWMIPDICHDDEDALKHFVSLAEGAAQRAATARNTKKSKAAKTKARA